MKYVLLIVFAWYTPKLINAQWTTSTSKYNLLVKSEIEISISVNGDEVRKFNPEQNIMKVPLDKGHNFLIFTNIGTGERKEEII